MGGSTQIKVVNEISQSFVQLPYKLLRKNSNFTHRKGVSATPGFPQ